MNKIKITFIVVIGLVIGLGLWFLLKAPHNQTSQNSQDAQTTTVGTNTNQEPASPAPAPVKKALPFKVLSNSDVAKYLADSNGMTVYTNSKETNLISTCYDACAKTWIPVIAPDDFDAKKFPDGQNIHARLNTIIRKDGTRQFAFGNQPIYYYAQDSKVGDLKGNAIDGVWAVVQP